MRSLADRLKAQNNGEVWIDCERGRGIPHRLVRDVVPGYWRCTRCPVSIRHPSAEDVVAGMTLEEYKLF